MGRNIGVRFLMISHIDIDILPPFSKNRHGRTGYVAVLLTKVMMCKPPLPHG
jgi:hypothetical protein